MQKSETKRHALVLGTSLYDDSAEFDTLDHVESDVDEIYSILTSSDVSIFSPKTSLKLLNKRKNKIDAALSDFFSNVGKEDLVVVYFAGHARTPGGARRLYLILTDSSANNLAGTALNVDHLIEFLDEKCVSRYIILLDCCHAGAALRSEVAKARGKQDEIKAFSDGAFLHEQGKVFLASCRDFQLSREDKNLGHGIFTFYAIDGIRTGNCTSPSSELAMITDVYAFVRTQMKTNHPDVYQDPVMSGQDLVGELPIALNPKHDTGFKDKNALSEYVFQSFRIAHLTDREEFVAGQKRKLRDFVRALAPTQINELDWRRIIKLHGDAIGLSAEAIEHELLSIRRESIFLEESTKANMPFANGPGREYLFAAAYGHVAMESNELEGGVFTHHLLRAIRGNASTDDGIVTVRSTFEYVTRQLSKLEERRQTPVFLSSNLNVSMTVTARPENWSGVHGKRFALIIGVNRYANDRIMPLRYAESDALSISEVLSSDVGRFQTVKLLGDQATRASIAKAISDAIATLEQPDLLLIYFSGHGIVSNEKSTWLVYDSDPIEQVGISTSSLALSLSNAKVGGSIVITDACANLGAIRPRIGLASAD